MRTVAAVIFFSSATLLQGTQVFNTILSVISIGVGTDEKTTAQWQISKSLLLFLTLPFSLAIRLPFASFSFLSFLSHLFTLSLSVQPISCV